MDGQAIRSSEEIKIVQYCCEEGECCVQPEDDSHSHNEPWSSIGSAISLRARDEVRNCHRSAENRRTVVEIRAYDLVSRRGRTVPQSDASENV